MNSYHCWNQCFCFLLQAVSLSQMALKFSPGIVGICGFSHKKSHSLFVCWDQRVTFCSVQQSSICPTHKAMNLLIKEKHSHIKTATCWFNEYTNILTKCSSTMANIKVASFVTKKETGSQRSFKIELQASIVGPKSSWRLESRIINSTTEKKETNSLPRKRKLGVNSTSQKNTPIGGTPEFTLFIWLWWRILRNRGSVRGCVGIVRIVPPL